MNIFQQIFTDHYEYIQYVIKPRPIVMENIDKLIHCGDRSFGGAMFACEKCGELKFVPFRCKCRLCPSCGTKYSIDRTNAMSFKVIKVLHRHCVFTIDSQLRPFFLKDRDLLNLLFFAVRSTFLRLFQNINKSESYVFLTATGFHIYVVLPNITYILCLFNSYIQKYMNTAEHCLL